MNREQRELLVDRLLNEALAAQPAEPRAGLEERILANLRAQPHPRPWWQWAPLSVGAAAVVLLAVLFGVWHGSQTRVPESEVRVAERAPAVAPPTAPAAPLVARHDQPKRAAAKPRVAATTTVARAEPRGAVFPSPVPLTPEEQLLIALAQRNRCEALLIARNQDVERDRMQKYFDTGEAPAPEPVPATNSR